MPKLTAHDRQLKGDAKVLKAIEQVVKKLRLLYVLDCIDIKHRDEIRSMKIILDMIGKFYDHTGRY